MLNQEQQSERLRLLDEVDRLQAEIDRDGPTPENERALAVNQHAIHALSESARALEFHNSIQRGLASGRLKVDRGIGTSSDDDRVPAVRDQALRRVDHAIEAGTLHSDGAEIIERAIEVGAPQGRSWSARWAAATGDPAYLSAFVKKVSDPDNGQLRWTPQEAEAWRTVTQVQAERAMSTTDVSGGFLIPFQLDPTILLTSGVKGHEELPSGGHENCPVVAMRSAHSRPPDVPPA